jgi:hypothetical protein
LASQCSRRPDELERESPKHTTFREARVRRSVTGPERASRAIERGGKTFDLAAPAVAVIRRQWGLERGTALRIDGPGDGITVGGEGVYFPGLPHALEAEMRPDLIVSAADFKALHATLIPFINRGVGDDGHEGARRFLMWDGGGGRWLAVIPFIAFVAIIVGGGCSQLQFSFGLNILVSVIMSAFAGWLIVGIGRRETLPKAALTFGEGAVTLSLLGPRPASLERGRIDKKHVEHIRWSPRYGSLDNPAIRLSLVPPRKFSVGSPSPWVGARGPNLHRRPDYLIGHVWWSSFVDAVTSEAATRSADCEPTPGSQ